MIGSQLAGYRLSVGWRCTPPPARSPPTEHFTPVCSRHSGSCRSAPQGEGYGTI